MNLSFIRSLIKDTYGIEVCCASKIKNVYKLEGKSKSYCLKVINYNLGHFLFIIAAIKHLQNGGFHSIPEIISTVKGNSYIEYQGSYAYLTEWINCRQCNYNNPLDLKIASQKLAELHLKSRNFSIESNMEPRIGWLKWIDTFRTRVDEIYSFREIILSREHKSKFDYLYMKEMEEQVSAARDSIINLCKSDYINQMKTEICKKGFCHHDYAHHNILIGENDNVNIIDFDYCILDSHLHDLCSLIIRRLKNNRWDLDCAGSIIGNYDKINKIHKEEIPIMSAFIEFPQDYWQLGIQYYLEKKQWDEEVFINKLKKIYEDRDDKYEFLYDFTRTIL
ncbi:MAG: CotS family spore coat protein [Solirubrobacterales bacterium]